MSEKTNFLIFGFVCVFVVSGNGQLTPNRFTNSSQTNNCDLTAKIEEKFHHLQAQVTEKFDHLRRELWSSSRNVEQQISATKSAIDHYRNEVRTQTERMRRNFQTQPREASVNTDLEREIQLIIVSLRLLLEEVANLGKNITDVSNTTNYIKQHLQVESSIQQVFSSPTQSTKTPSSVPTSCQDIKQNNDAAGSSVYLVQPKDSAKPFMVYCDMQEQGGGWLTIHNRFLGEQDFYRDWQDYKVGFGNIAGEHWLGLERVHELTGQEIHELLVQLVDDNDVKTYAYYSDFSVGSEEEGYSLKVLGGYRGNAGDSLMYHAGSKFSTRDRDQDSWVEGNCAQSHGGAWWYKSCDKSNLNGRYLPGEQPDILIYQPMYWGSFKGPQNGLKYARMMVRPKQGTNDFGIHAATDLRL